jgi:hypothetical protein
VELHDWVVKFLLESSRLKSNYNPRKTVKNPRDGDERNTKELTQQLKTEITISQTGCYETALKVARAFHGNPIKLAVFRIRTHNLITFHVLKPFT